jgi:putative membrane-bound dehydrogenase-like protein
MILSSPRCSFIRDALRSLRAILSGLALCVMGFSLSTVNQVDAQGLTPEEAVSRMQVDEGLRVDLVASEPLVRQPVAIDWDDRGRLWVIQYLQYPNPEGLQRISVDRYSRTRYDRIPPPPPLGPRGADRLTILSDSDGDGRMDQSKDFVDGLNLASGFAFGHGGVFVLNVPYLLYYPDRDRDDRPDSDPIVLLEGFGMQDAHSVANSLTWGPDGWLYGCQGSTVTSLIRGIEFQQGVWRYHPKSKAFELFCEGGGNCWGLDFDATGHLLYSTNFGGYVLLHGVQGAYYAKTFAKHGALHNPFTFGYFEHTPHANFTGGHVTVGGTIYQSDRLPEKYRGRYLGADLLGHAAHWHHIEPRGSTVSTSHGGTFLSANDPWFAPSDLTIGPDGAIYIADWHDARMAHPDPDAQWDRSNGRVYRITSSDGPYAVKTPDLATLSDDGLLSWIVPGIKTSGSPMSKRDAWHTRRARTELIRRYASFHSGGSHAPNTLIEPLRRTALESSNADTALQAFWTWTCLANPSESDWQSLLDSPHPAVRRWTVRWLGDLQSTMRSPMSTELAHHLDALAEIESDIHVRQQLACTAARLPANIAMPIINANINRSIDLDDPFIPLLWWWAIERHCITGNEEVLKRFVRPTLWKSQLGRDNLLPLLARRYAAESTSVGLDSLVRLLRACPTLQDRLALWREIDLGLALRSTIAQSNESVGSRINTDSSTRDVFLTVLREERDQQPSNLPLIRVAIRLGDPTGERDCIDYLHDHRADGTSIAEFIDALSLRPRGDQLELIEGILQQTQDPAVAIACLNYLGKIGFSGWSERLLDRLARDESPKIRERTIAILVSNRSTALQLLHRIDRQQLAITTLSVDQVRSLAGFQDASIDELVRKHWGRLASATPEEKLAEVRRLNNDLRAASGDRERGKKLFEEHCASCHRLFGEGKEVGPELTSANRKDRDYLLVSIVDPSSTIRREYMSTAIRTQDGRILTGLVRDAGSGKVIVHVARGEPIELSLDEIDEMKESEMSLMPEDLYRTWSPQVLRDLFAYLQSDEPLPK